MKKLTAGIFATILGLTAMGAADAAVTSKGYVDTAIGALETAYKAADTALDGKITAEATTRETKDNELQAAIDAIEGVQGDYATKTELQAETDARAQADTALDGKITAEATTRETKDNELQAAIDAIEGVQGDYATKTELQAETDARTQADTDLETAYKAADTALETAYKAADTALDGKITAEATTRETKDNELQAAIDAIEGGVEDITGADENTENVKYALTKIVTENDDGTKTTSYGWELIDREYTEGNVTANGK